ncbi:MAG: hypothetical protein ABI573_05805 [Chloroflexota bacterium]
MAEFQWWLLLVGLVVGGGIVAVVYLDGSRREQDLESRELPAEAAWIADRLTASGRSVDASAVEQVLREHRAYRAELPPDRILPGDERLEGSDVWSGS